MTDIPEHFPPLPDGGVWVKSLIPFRGYVPVYPNLKTRLPFKDVVGSVSGFSIVAAFVAAGFLEFIFHVTLGSEARFSEIWFSAMLTLASTSIGYLFSKKEDQIKAALGELLPSDDPDGLLLEDMPMPMDVGPIEDCGNELDENGLCPLCPHRGKPLPDDIPSEPKGF